MLGVMLAGSWGQLLIGHRVYHYSKVDTTVFLNRFQGLTDVGPSVSCDTSVNDEGIAVYICKGIL